MRSPTVQTLVLFALGMTFLGVGFTNHDLSAPDEPRFALVAREMIQNNTWLLPHRNERPYPDKPPLFFWSIAAISALQGGEVSVFSARLPSVLAAALICVLIYGLVIRSTRDSILSWVSVVTLMASSKFFLQAHIAQIDMVLCLFTTASLVLGFRYISDKGSRGMAMAMGLCMGLGILAKGPVALIVPTGSLVLFCLFSGPGALRRFPFRALLWALLPPLLWLVGLGLEVYFAGQWDYLANLLFKQTVVRYFDPWHHYQPFYYFLLTVLYDFLPWGALLYVIAPFRRQQRAKCSDLERLGWATVVFTVVFFSLSAGKRNLYILPMYPFAAVLVGVRIRDWLSRPMHLGERLAMGVMLSLIAVAGCAVIALALGWWVPSELEALRQAMVPPGSRQAQGLLPRTPVLVLGTAITLSACVAAWAWATSRVRPAFATTVAAMMALCLLFYTVIQPAISPYRSARAFVEASNGIMDAMDRPIRLAMVDYRSAYRLFGHHRIVELDKGDGRKRDLPTLEAFWRENPRGLVYIRDQDYERLVVQVMGNPPHRVLLQGPVGSSRMLLVEGTVGLDDPVPAQPSESAGSRKSGG